MSKPNEAEVVLAGCLGVLLIMMLNIIAMCIGGIVLAWCWNIFLVPSTEMPALTWYQGAIGIFAIRFVLGFFR